MGINHIVNLIFFCLICSTPFIADLLEKKILKGNSKTKDVDKSNIEGEIDLIRKELKPWDNRVLDVLDARRYASICLASNIEMWEMTSYHSMSFIRLEASNEANRILESLVNNQKEINKDG